jgi:hypothetical protein
MALKIAAFVDEEEVPQARRGGPSNPEVTEILEQLIDAADKGSTNFAFIPVEDKIERKRIGENIRLRAKAKGYLCEKIAGTRTRKIKGKGTVIAAGLYIRVSRPPEDETEQPRKRRRVA